MSRIGKRIKEERTKQGLTAKQLGKKCGTTESFILDIESGTKIINEKLLAQISKVLGTKLEESMLIEASEEKKPQEERADKKPQKVMETQTVKRSEVEPLPQWGDALSNIIKQIPIYDINMLKSKGYKNFPIIDKKVEGYNPDKLAYIEAPDDSLLQYRIKKGDRCLIYLNNEFKHGNFYLVEYDNKRLIRKIKKLEGNKIQLVEGTQDNKAIILDLKKVKIFGKLIRVEIDF